MKYYQFIAITILSLPQLTFAQTTPSLQTFLPNLMRFIENVIIPFLFALAFFVFVYSAFKYFILESASEDGREKAKNLALYTFGAFVFLIIFWGLINIITNATGLQEGKQTCPDYLKDKGAC